MTLCVIIIYWVDKKFWNCRGWRLYEYAIESVTIQDQKIVIHAGEPNTRRRHRRLGEESVSTVKEGGATGSYGVYALRAWKMMVWGQVSTEI